jgi:hypothetical protein
MNRTSKPAGTQSRKNARIFAVSVLALVLGMVALAVAAKTFHYSAHSTETRYFSSSVKMANYGHRQAPTIRHVAVPAPLVRIEEPEQIVVEFRAPQSLASAPGKSGPQQLRSPPVIS